MVKTLRNVSKTVARVTLPTQVQVRPIRTTTKEVVHQQLHTQKMSIINNKILAIKPVHHLNLVNIKKDNSNHISNLIKNSTTQIGLSIQHTKMKFPLNTMVILLIPIHF